MGMPLNSLTNLLLAAQEALFSHGPAGAGSQLPGLGPRRPGAQSRIGSPSTSGAKKSPAQGRAIQGEDSTDHIWLIGKARRQLVEPRPVQQFNAVGLKLEVLREQCLNFLGF